MRGYVNVPTLNTCSCHFRQSEIYVQEYLVLLKVIKTHWFCVDVHVHLIGKPGYIHLSAKYIQRDLFLNYWSRCGYYTVVLVATVMRAL
jgi:hypothetical protein